MTDLRTLAKQDDQRPLLCALLRDFHRLGWVSGTGGGICGPASEDSLWIAPTGVHKELVEPQDFFEMRLDGALTSEPAGLRPSECAPIFLAIARATGARSVLHSHALSAVLAADGRQGDTLIIEGFEMLKGVGLSNTEKLSLPVIANTEREYDLTGSVSEALTDPRFSKAHAVMVADHGCYLWGSDVMEAKKHAEVYHWLFEGVVARNRM